MNARRLVETAGVSLRGGKYRHVSFLQDQGREFRAVIHGDRTRQRVRPGEAGHGHFGAAPELRQLRIDVQSQDSIDKQLIHAIAIRYNEGDEVIPHHQWSRITGHEEPTTSVSFHIERDR